MTSAGEPTVVRLSNLGDIVDAVPYLLGFTPTESIVAVALRGPRERMSFSVRCDLADPECDDVVAQMLASRMRYADADAVMLFVYTAESADACEELPRRALVTSVIDRMQMPVRDAVVVTDDRVWSYLCADADCCAPQGRERTRDTPGSLALSAAHAMRGRAVLPDRDSVVMSVQPVEGNDADVMDRAIESAGTTYAAVGPQRFRADARELAGVLRERYLSRPGTITDDEAAQLVVALHDVELRDELLEWALADEDVMRSLFADVARRALPPLDAPACAALAWVAYLRGEGLVVATALERARASDPEYQLAVLLANALDQQLSPVALRTAFAGSRSGRG